MERAARDFHRKPYLGAQNLAIDGRIGEGGVDAETWPSPLPRGDDSRWPGAVIQDARVADIVEGIERQPDLPPAHSRRLVGDTIAARYTLPE